MRYWASAVLGCMCATACRRWRRCHQLWKRERTKFRHENPPIYSVALLLSLNMLHWWFRVREGDTGNNVIFYQTTVDHSIAQSHQCATNGDGGGGGYEQNKRKKMNINLFAFTHFILVVGRCFFLGSILLAVLCFSTIVFFSSCYFK